MLKDEVQRLENTPVEEIIKEVGKKPARYGLANNQKAMHFFMNIIGKRPNIPAVFVGPNFFYAFNNDGSLLAFVRDFNVYFFPTNDATFNRSIAKQFDAAQRQR